MKRRGAFTMIEFVIVAAILASAGFVAYSTLSGNAQKQDIKNLIKEVVSMADATKDLKDAKIAKKYETDIDQADVLSYMPRDYVVHGTASRGFISKVIPDCTFTINNAGIAPLNGLTGASGAAGTPALTGAVVPDASTSTFNMQISCSESKIFGAEAVATNKLKQQFLDQVSVYFKGSSSDIKIDSLLTANQLEIAIIDYY